MRPGRTGLYCQIISSENRDAPGPGRDPLGAVLRGEASQTSRRPSPWAAVAAGGELSLVAEGSERPGRGRGTWAAQVRVCVDRERVGGQAGRAGGHPCRRENPAGLCAWRSDRDERGPVRVCRHAGGTSAATRAHTGARTSAGARWGGDALGRGRAASDSPTCLLSLLVKEKVDGIAGSSGMQKEAPSRNKNTLRKPPGERNLVEQARHCSSPNSQKLRPLGKNPACVCVCVHVCVTVTE